MIVEVCDDEVLSIVNKVNGRFKKTLKFILIPLFLFFSDREIEIEWDFMRYFVELLRSQYIAYVN